MKTMSDYLYGRYFNCDVNDKQFYFDLYLKAYFKEKQQWIN